MAGEFGPFRCTAFPAAVTHCDVCHNEWITGQGWPQEVYRSDVEQRYFPTEANALLALSCCSAREAVTHALAIATGVTPPDGGQTVRSHGRLSPSTDLDVPSLPRERGAVG